MESHSCRSLLALQYLLSLLLLFISINIIFNIHTTSATSYNSSTVYKLYVKNSCNSTLYPQKCYESLSSYSTKIKSDPKRLCRYAIYVAYIDAKTASSTAVKISKTKGLKATEKEVITDCVENIKDSVTELKNSWRAMDNLISGNGTLSEDEKYQTVENVKSWVSAASTDDYTCTDEIEEEKVNPTMKSKLNKACLKLSKSTSIALAFTNSY
ncbi:21 kDa protein [Morus notabilis]|uniref:21 kDa protein n=1 Tax=Morus notabilis TaxID=981085 RepID=W9SN02_9ROSA|nr:pectinesterase inhibitor 4 [Morus notabilis]EXC65559.1 21 kDa protein [Morus notabilis]